MSVGPAQQKIQQESELQQKQYIENHQSPVQKTISEHGEEKKSQKGQSVEQTQNFGESTFGASVNVKNESELGGEFNIENSKAQVPKKLDQQQEINPSSQEKEQKSDLLKESQAEEQEPQEKVEGQKGELPRAQINTEEQKWAQKDLQKGNAGKENQKSKDQSNPDVGNQQNSEGHTDSQHKDNEGVDAKVIESPENNQSQKVSEQQVELQKEVDQKGSQSGVNDKENDSRQKQDANQEGGSELHESIIKQDENKLSSLVDQGDGSEVTEKNAELVDQGKSSEAHLERQQGDSEDKDKEKSDQQPINLQQQSIVQNSEHHEKQPSEKNSELPQISHSPSSAGLVLANDPSQPHLEDSFVKINKDLSQENSGSGEVTSQAIDLQKLASLASELGSRVKQAVERGQSQNIKVAHKSIDSRLYLGLKDKQHESECKLSLNVDLGSKAVGENVEKLSSQGLEITKQSFNFVLEVEPRSEKSAQSQGDESFKSKLSLELQQFYKNLTNEESKTENDNLFSFQIRETENKKVLIGVVCPGLYQLFKAASSSVASVEEGSSRTTLSIRFKETLSIEEKFINWLLGGFELRYLSSGSQVLIQALKTMLFDDQKGQQVEFPQQLLRFLKLVQSGNVTIGFKSVEKVEEFLKKLDLWELSQQTPQNKELLQEFVGHFNSIFNEENPELRFIKTVILKCLNSKDFVSDSLKVEMIWGSSMNVGLDFKGVAKAFGETYRRSIEP